MVGKASLSDPDKIILDVAAIVKEDFLQQNGYSTWDYRCPLYKTDWMMKNLMLYFDEADKCCRAGAQWNRVREATKSIETELRKMKFRVSPTSYFCYSVQSTNNFPVPRRQAPGGKHCVLQRAGSKDS